MADFSVTSVQRSEHIAHALTFAAQPDRRQISDRRQNWRGGRRISDFSAFSQRAGSRPQPPLAHTNRQMHIERLH